MDDQDAGMPFLTQSPSVVPPGRQRDVVTEARGYPGQNHGSVGRFRSHSMERSSHAQRRPGHASASKSKLPTTAPLMTKVLEF